jgi:GH43 family beta-xylosidase
MALQRHDANKIDKKKYIYFLVSADNFAPVLSLSQQDIFVLPIQLPAMITSKDDTELRQTLTTLRRAHMDTSTYRHKHASKSIYHQKTVFHLALTNIYLPTQIASIEGIFNL